MINRYRSIWEICILINLQSVFSVPVCRNRQLHIPELIYLIACSIRCQLIAPQILRRSCTQCHSRHDSNSCQHQYYCLPFHIQSFPARPTRLAYLLFPRATSQTAIFARVVTSGNALVFAQIRRLRIIPFYAFSTIIQGS